MEDSLDSWLGGREGTGVSPSPCGSTGQTVVCWTSTPPRWVPWQRSVQLRTYLRREGYKLVLSYAGQDSLQSLRNRKLFRNWCVTERVILISRLYRPLSWETHPVAVLARLCRNKSDFCRDPSERKSPNLPFQQPNLPSSRNVGIAMDQVTAHQCQKKLTCPL